MSLRFPAAALLVGLACVPARAAFDFGVYSPRAAGMGGATTSVSDDPTAMFSNPATLAGSEHAAVALDYLRQYHLPAGPVNDSAYNVVGALPVHQEIFNGTFGFALLSNRQRDFATERTFAAGYGARSLWASDDKAIDAGLTLKGLRRSLDVGGNSALQAAVDLGMLLHWGQRYAAGFSLLNANRPSTSAGSFKDRAPLEARFGLSESVRGFLWTLDVAKREPSAFHPSSAEIAGGFERWWATARHGSFAGRAGMSLGDREKTGTWGLGWRVMGAELSYAQTVPFVGRSKYGHALGLTFRFGQSNPEAEYEKVLQGEVRYRRDLLEALQASDVKQIKLSEELKAMRQELDDLSQKLAAKTSSEAEARRRLKDLEERHQRAADALDKLKKDPAKAKSQQTLFDEDWAAYQRQKLSGAPDAALADQVKRLLQQYKDKGVDLSQANQELLRLLRNK